MTLDYLGIVVAQYSVVEFATVNKHYASSTEETFLQDLLETLKVTLLIVHRS